MKYTPAVFIILLFACQQNNKPVIERSFYHWKTSIANDSTVGEFIKTQKISHIYVHLFDVVTESYTYDPEPVAEIVDPQNAAPIISGTFTPVVFISNQCFEKMTSYWEALLPEKIYNKVIFFSRRLLMASGRNDTALPAEIQIDCDWTTGTQKRYFDFLTRLKAINPSINISCTIRMYPFKYRVKMGVPPVDKGLLMCYNLSPIKEASNSNSIFRLDELKQYLIAPKYPIHLDIALPVFGWYAWFRDGDFKKIVYPNIDEENPDRIPGNWMKTETNSYRIGADTVISDNYVREGDVLRVEFPEARELEQAYTLLRSKIPDLNRVAFYHLDKELIKRYESTISTIYNQ